MSETRDKVAEVIGEAINNASYTFDIADQIIAIMENAPVDGWKYKCQEYGSLKEYQDENVCDKCIWKKKCSVMGYRPALQHEVNSNLAVREG